MSDQHICSPVDVILAVQRRTWTGLLQRSEPEHHPVMTGLVSLCSALEVMLDSAAQHNDPCVPGIVALARSVEQAIETFYQALPTDGDAQQRGPERAPRTEIPEVFRTAFDEPLEPGAPPQPPA